MTRQLLAALVPAAQRAPRAGPAALVPATLRLLARVCGCLSQRRCGSSRGPGGASPGDAAALRTGPAACRLLARPGGVTSSSRGPDGSGSSSPPASASAVLFLGAHVLLCLQSPPMATAPRREGATPGSLDGGRVTARGLRRSWDGGRAWVGPPKGCRVRLAGQRMRATGAGYRAR